VSASGTRNQAPGTSDARYVDQKSALRSELDVGLGDPIHIIPGLAQVFEADAIPTRASDNVRDELWRKLIINCAYNAISLLARQPYRQSVPSVGIRDVIQDVVDECLAVAAAEGTSTAGDILRGKPTKSTT